jgi:PPP family 3-phenylpropionic acid transporter
MHALSLYWFLYLGAYGMLLPYFSLYLSDNAGLSGTEVGMVVTMAPLVALVAPTVWGRIADRSRSRVRVMAIATFGVALVAALFAALSGFWGLVAGAIALAVFTTGLFPLVIAATLAALGENASEGFGRIRVWGTVGFLVVVVAFPALLRALGDPPSADTRPSQPGLWLMFPATALMVLAAALVALRIPDAPAIDVRQRDASWIELLRHPPFVRLLALSFGLYLFFQGPMSLFPLYLRGHGGGVDTVSRMWIFMLLLEIPLIAFSGTGLRHLGPRGLLIAGFAAGGIRWLVCGLVRDLRAIYLVQLLHGVTVAGAGIGSALYVEASVPARLRSTGQALNSTAGLGIGSIVSNVAAGWLMDHASVDAPFLVGGAGTLLLALLVPVVLPPPRRFAD